MQKRPVPAVSVVMPAYNAEKYLREAIDSILSQTFTDFEFIIINDGSTDRTKEIILDYDDPRIIYIENEHNSGICVTLNKGLDVARGRYIVRMDSDDISLPARVAEQVEFMERQPEVGVAGCLVERFYDDNLTMDFPPSEFDYYLCRASLLFSTCLAHPAAIIRSEIIKRYDLRYDDQYRGMEDFHLWWNMSFHSFVTNVPKVLLKYRIHKNQVTQIPLNDDFIRRQRAFVCQRLADMGLIDTPSAYVEVMLQYILKPDDFDDDKLETFIQTLSDILRHIKQDRKYHAAQKLIAARAISYGRDLSAENLKKSNLHYMWRAYVAHCMPFSWFAKRVYHALMPLY